MAAFHLQLLSQLKEFIDDVEAGAAGICYVHGEPIPALATPVSDSVFCFGSIKDFPDGQACASVHCDGGPSTIFLAITLCGERFLDIECVDPQSGEFLETKTVHCVPGHVYLSSPACFWHAVRPVPSPVHAGLQRTLILRSNCMRWRHSGGKLLGDGNGRSGGFVYGTAPAFEEFASVVARAIERMSHFSLLFT